MKKLYIISFLLCTFLSLLIPCSLLYATDGVKNEAIMYLEAPGNAAYIGSPERESIVNYSSSENELELKTIERVFSKYEKMSYFLFWVQSGFIIAIIVLLFIISRQHLLLKNCLKCKHNPLNKKKS